MPNTADTGNKGKMTALQSFLKNLLGRIKPWQMYLVPNVVFYKHNNKEQLLYVVSSVILLLSCLDDSVALAFRKEKSTSPQWGKGKGQHQNFGEIPYLYNVKIELLTPSPLYLYRRISLLSLIFHLIDHLLNCILTSK